MKRTALFLAILGLALCPFSANAEDRTTGAIRAHVHVTNGKLGVWFGAPNLTDKPGKEYVEVFRNFKMQKGWIEAGGGVFFEDGVLTPALDLRGYGRQGSMSSFFLLQALDPTEKEGVLAAYIELDYNFPGDKVFAGVGTDNTFRRGADTLTIGPVLGLNVSRNVTFIFFHELHGREAGEDVGNKFWATLMLTY